MTYQILCRHFIIREKEMHFSKNVQPYIYFYFNKLGLKI